MSRSGFKWSVNEILSLQREFELLGWSIDQIATKHKRTPNAIMYKLDQEGFADYNILYSNYHSLNSPMSVQKMSNLSLNYDYESEIDDSVEHDDKSDEDYVDNPDIEDDEDDEQVEMDILSHRVYKIETAVYEIQLILEDLMSKQNNTSKKSLSKSIF